MIARLLLVTIACAAAAVNMAHSAVADQARYLFTWVGDGDRADSDFLAVVDLTPSDGRYGEIIATHPVGEKALWPHHTEHEFASDGLLFATGFAGNRSFIFDLRDPRKPAVVGRFGSVNGLSFLHSFARLANGNVLATFQGHGPENSSPGGLAEIDSGGRVVRSTTTADASADQATLRPYSLAVVPSLDRVVVGLTFMGFPGWSPARASIEHDHRGNQVQVWRLSTLTLVKTIKLAEPEAPNEPRLLSDAKTVLVNTATCRLYRVAGLATMDPTLELVHTASTRGCPTPVVVGNFWVQANAAARRVFALDVTDLSRVREVSSVSFDERQSPHWVATDGKRIVVANEPGGEPRLWMLRIDSSTGQLTLDESFRDAGSNRPGVSFDRDQWPHGATGRAVPHGTVFGR